MKKRLINCSLAILATLLSACAAPCKKSEKLSNVVTTQSRVIEMVVKMRSTDDVKNRIKADPVLAVQEEILIDALNGVIDSQEPIKDATCSKAGCGGTIANKY
jgi:hypothetical protein